MSDEPIVAGEVRKDPPPDGKHMWVIWVAFELREEKVDESIVRGANDDGYKELDMRDDVVGILVAEPPVCFKCGERPEDCSDIPCVGARGRRREGSKRDQ